jgi:hypothetical protein
MEVRHVRIAFSFFSLLLFAVTAVLWVRSYSRADLVFDTRYFPADRTAARNALSPQLIHRDTIIWTFRGEFMFITGRHRSAGYRHVDSAWNWQSFPFVQYIPGPSAISHFGFSFDEERQRDGSWIGFGIPLWIIIPFTVIAPICLLSNWRQSRSRLGAGRCTSCAYNLTGNVSGICPECGTPVPSLRGSG